MLGSIWFSTRGWGLGHQSVERSHLPLFLQQLILLHMSTMLSFAEPLQACDSSRTCPRFSHRVTLYSAHNCIAVAWSVELTVVQKKELPCTVQKPVFDSEA